MAILSDQLPTLLVLAVLVGIFVALGRHVKSERLVLWATGWILIFVHFLATFLVPSAGNVAAFVFGVSQGALALAALFFVSSLTFFFEDKVLTMALRLL